MDDADRPMSQADIDAMLAAAQGSSGPAAAVPAASGAVAPAAASSPFRATFSESDDSPAPAPPVTPAAPAAPAAPVVPVAPAAPAAPPVPDLAARLAKVEAALERLGQIEKTVADMGGRCC